jgi:hypothetical protein
VNVAPPATKPDRISPTPPSFVALGGNAQALGGAGGINATPAASTAGGATPAASTAAPAGQLDIDGITRVFGSRFAQMMQQNPLAAMLALGALGSVLGSGGFNPLQLNGANNGAQAAAGGPQALASTGGTNQTVAPPASATPGPGNAELDAMLGAGGRGMMFEDKVALMMCQIVKKMQEDIEKRLEKLKAQAEAADKGGGGGGGGFLGGLLGGGGGGGGMLGGILGMAGNMIMPGIGGAVGGMAGNMLGGATGGGGAGGGAGGSGGGQESRNIEFEMLKNEMQKLSQMQQAFSNVLNEMHQLAMNAIRSIAK